MFPVARKRFIARCRGAAFSPVPSRPGSPRLRSRPIRLRLRPSGSSPRQLISPTSCHRTSRLFSACRGSRWRSSSTSRRTASISIGGGSSSMPARISMRRSTSPKPARPPRRSRPTRWWCRSRWSMLPPRRRRTPITSSRARISRRGRRSTAGFPTIAASPCIRAARSTSAMRRNTPARMHQACSTSPASVRRPRNG